MLPSSNITPCSRTISRLMILWTWCCSEVTSRDKSSMRSKGMTHTSSILQGDSITGVLVVHDAVQANDFARHLKPRHLVSDRPRWPHRF